MHVAVDLSTFRTYQGTEVYAEHMVRALLSRPGEQRFSLYMNKGMFPALVRFAEADPRVRIVYAAKRKINSGVLLALYQQCVLPFRMRGADVLYSPSPFAPMLFRGRTVVTIHDAAYRHFREFRNPFSRLYIGAAIARARSHARSATVSEFSRQELAAEYGFSPEAVVVTHEGVPRLPDPDESVFSRLGIAGDYFMSVGSPRPRKNTERLLDAFVQFRSARPAYRLVMIGAADRGFMDLAAELSRRGLSDSVVAAGFVTDAEKAALYRNSRGLVFVSLYEGFGLPILEAQSLGTPVLTSDRTAMPEVAGAGALFADPESIASIAAGMETLIADETARARIVAAGAKNIERFSWAAAAETVWRALSHTI